MKTLNKKLTGRNEKLFNNAYAYLLEASRLNEEELQSKIEKGYLIEIQPDNHTEFYETNKKAITTLLSDVNCGDYYFLQETYTEFARELWLSVTTNDIYDDPLEAIAHDTVYFVLNAVIKIIKKERA